MTDYLRFEELSALPIEELHVDNGIGTQSEKYLHILLKNYFEPDKSCHEVKIGRFTADICNENHIIEIQTRGFNLLREKLGYYLLEGYEVTVVHPIPRIRRLLYVDPDTGEVANKRKHPHTGSWYDAIPELYKIKYFLDWDNFNIRLIMFDIDEYREYNSDRKRRGRRRSTRLERMPIAIGDSIILENPADYLIFMPEGLKHEFSSTDFAKFAKINTDVARTALNILTYLGTVEHVDTVGRRYIYRLNKYFDTSDN